MDTPSTEPANQVTPAAPKEKSSVGTLIVLLVIVAMIVVGAFYVWGQRVAEDRGTPPVDETVQ